ncbi:pilus assembly protein [Photobacterium sanctipauli]|uniref:Pilus assembly protein n=1 Tax=Photobacterium sanctipauli TaxID=1342794 RepID=A0A2T3NPY0_9GAMM|nr:VWA domain-containing protein [Photobacterium sanctipauli]PSW18335.1 pilus assembly protein [Photobacterium sanctipauli]
MNNQSFNKQQGIATIYVAMSLVGLFGIIFWATEGTRYIQKQNRLADATEAAVLALSSANAPGHYQDENNSIGYQPTATEVELTQSYIQHYVRHTQAIPELTITRFDGKEITNEVDLHELGRPTEYYQYAVEAKTEHLSWFHSDIVPSFDQTQLVANRARSKSYIEYLGDRSIDLVFVSDFSGSMNDPKSKIRDLKQAIETLSYEVLESNSYLPPEQHNRIGFVPFNIRVQEYSNNKLLCTSQTRYKNRRHFNGFEYESINWSRWIGKSLDSIEQCSRGQNYSCPQGNGKYRQEARTVYDAISTARKEASNKASDLPDPYAYIDMEETVHDLFSNKISTMPNLQFTANYSNRAPFTNGMCQGNFYTIGLTSSANGMNPVQTMRPKGGTAVYNGIIRGAQVLNSGRPISPSEEEEEAYRKRVKMMLILTDGEEDPFEDTFDDLVGIGMCEAIRNKFSDSEVPMYIGVLGIQFKPDAQSGYKQCVINPDDDIIDINNTAEILEEIKNLIQNGTQAESISRLEYRHSPIGK